MVVLASGKGNGKITLVDIAVDLHNSRNVLVKVTGDGFHHVDFLNEMRLESEIEQMGKDMGFFNIDNSNKGTELSDIGGEIPLL
jgi:hypothetical protein